MASKGSVWASGSQDYDSLLFGSPRLVRNLTITGKRKLPGKREYVTVEPEEIMLGRVLERLGISREQLVEVAVLVGTDFNEGVKGVGPKRALQLIKTYGGLEKALKILGVRNTKEFLEAKEIFLYPKVTNEYKLEWRAPDAEKIFQILVLEHDFNEERVRRAVERLAKAWKEKIRYRQMGLDAFFKKR
jgi:flap endonuclease-1